MKLPVPFSVHASVVAQLKAEIDRAEKRYADLMASYRMLKLQGAVDVTPTPRPEPVKIDPVERAIREECAGKDPAVQRMMREQVKADRAAGMEEDEIVALIKRGNLPAEEMAS